MGKITAGQDFGQQVAPPRRLNEVATPRAAFGVTDALMRQGEGMEREALQIERERLHEQRTAPATPPTAHRRRPASACCRIAWATSWARSTTACRPAPSTRRAPAKEWNERSARVLQDGLAEIPETHRGNAAIVLKAHAERMTSKVGDSVRRRDQADTLSGINQTLEYAQRLSVQNPQQARQLVGDTLEQLGPHAGLRPTSTKARQGFIEGAAYTRAFTAVNGAKGDNRALSAVEKAITSNADLDPQRQAQLLAQIDNHRANNEARAIRAAQKAEIAAARHEREAGQAWNVLSGWALAGKAANPEASAGLLKKLSGTPYEAAYKALAAEIPARATAAMQPIDVQQRELDGLIARRNAQGTSQPLEQEITRREQLLTSARREYEAEPLRAGAERGVIEQVRPIDFTSLDAIPQVLGERISQAQTVATRTGRPVSPLLSDEASKVGDMLNTLPPAQRAQRIAQLAKMLPPGMGQALAKQIAPKDKGLALEMATGLTATNSGTFVSEWIARGRQALKDGTIKEDSAKQTGLRSQLVAEVGDALNGPARDDVIEAARLAWIGQQAAGLSPSVKGAVRLAIGGEIVEHNGKRIPVPAGVDLPTALRSPAARAVLAQSTDGNFYAAGQPIPADRFVNGLPEAQLEPAGEGRYFVRAGGSLVTNAQRRPIVVEVR